MASQGNRSTTINVSSSANNTSSCFKFCASFRNFIVTSLPLSVCLCKMRLLHSYHSSGKRSHFLASTAKEESLPIFSLINMRLESEQKITLCQRHNGNGFTRNWHAVNLHFVILRVHINLWRSIVVNQIFFGNASANFHRNNFF